ncbi:MAG: hypothetical protein CL927_10395 [Deltaproteobacteria bacterium]|nr:hypothetical protein [Deltaproteobacteria bacterium]HCH66556.1 hypothetical protein [Deltaproteobacteria bacterium]
MQTLPPIRRFVPSLDAIAEVFGINVDSAVPEVCEHVYLDQAYPQLPLDGYLRMRRAVPSESPPFDDEATWALELRPDGARPLRVLAEEVDQAECIDLAGTHGHTGVSPRFGVRFERRRYIQDTLVIDVDTEVTYFAIRRSVYRIARENASRVTIRMLVPGQEEAVAEALAGLSALPYSTKCMMGYSALEQAFRIPKYNELPGYEFEAKLEADHLDIDHGGLPFPVLEVVQSDSIRMYFKGHRVNTRAGTARTIIKGTVEALPGQVLKRTEAKVPDVDPWEVGAPRMEMRRYKRKVNVLNPATMRVYTVSLHLCESSVTPRDSDASLMQVEIEYEGTMLPHMTRRMAELEATGDLDILFELAEQSIDQGQHEVGLQLLGRIPALTDDPFLRRRARALIDRVQPRAARPIASGTEAEVVADIAFLRQHLETRYAYRNTRLTKRKWLKATRRSSAS